MDAHRSARRCCQCGTRLARDNADRRCSACRHRARAALASPPDVPPEFWLSPPMREALSARHMGEVIRAFRTHPYHGKIISQGAAAAWVYLTQSQLSRIENGPPVQDLDRLIRWAHTLRVPPHLLWFALPGEDRPEDGLRAESSAFADGEWMGEGDVRRRMFLAGGLAAATLPAIGVEGLRHIAAALEDAHRYADGSVVGHFRQQLDACAAEDRAYGPKRTLPAVLGVVAAIEHTTRHAKTAVRPELLRLGARGAEFAGWLYRDITMPELANYWRDRAVEYAQAAGDLPMQGYVLLKKSQSAWDERDGLRMLTLAQAAQQGPWQLPARVRAEAVQQEARGHAMLTGDWALVEPKLDEARTLLETSTPGVDGPGTHYGEALFTIQTAICFGEAGKPQQAVALYDQALSGNTFSRRDRGYFLSLQGKAYAAAHSPDDAARAGLDALALARETDSARTMQELARLVRALRPWQAHSRVRSLRDAVLA
ncbi:helix-turn-helix domain-containing protein [Actinomadura scrupuli]|uniref:helix-turn-helix domain-containing protein n=1 Tax=Actinomadura scrupuli TaxID=559629 RepID=UPI003D96555C